MLSTAKNTYQIFLRANSSVPCCAAFLDCHNCFVSHSTTLLEPYNNYRILLLDMCLSQKELSEGRNSLHAALPQNSDVEF